MKVAILSSSLSRRGGGVSEVARSLAKSLSNFPGVNVSAFGLNDDQIEKDMVLWEPLPLNVCDVVGPSSFGYAPNLLPSLKNSGVQLIHLHGLWQYTSVACLISGIPYITTVHGMLDQWALKNSGFKKKIVNVLYERAALRKAICIQAFTEQEYNDIRQLGFRNPVCIIPNGVDISDDKKDLRTKAPIWTDFLQPEEKVMLYLGRIHPKKGLTNLINAWHQLKSLKGDLSKNWKLVIAGWDQGGYEHELKRMVQNMGINETVCFIGPQFNIAKRLAFAHADAFILPSFSEGLPMAVLEAWAYELPVLLTRQCNLQEGIESGAALEIEANVDSIFRGLVHFFSKPQSDLIQMGLNGRSLVEKKFSWQNVGEQMHQVYNWVVNKSSVPPTIIFD